MFRLERQDSDAALTSISAVDGRYQPQLEDLRDYASEAALIGYRTLIEVEWFIHLLGNGPTQLRQAISSDEIATCRRLYQNFSNADAAKVKRLEKTTNHDIKAVEYFVREKLAEIFQKRGQSINLELVHFACTSEDINNLAYGLILRDLRTFVLLPSCAKFLQSLMQLAERTNDIPMLSRTHGQAASPTTVGKELTNFIERATAWSEELRAIDVRGKVNGAVGNFNAHFFVDPSFDWIGLSRQFVERLGLTYAAQTTQIEPHDYMARYFRAVIGFNQVILDLDRDVWGYLSLGYFKQRTKKHEVGSSTMPHKVNPIDFENSEGNVGISNALLSHLSEKLPVSRWQRDLSDSTVQRNVGVAIGHTLLAMRSSTKGLNKLDVNRQAIAQDLDSAYEVLTEALQVSMRAEGIVDSYEKIKDIARGRAISRSDYLAMVEKSGVSLDKKLALRSLKPDQYTGRASQLSRECLIECGKRLETISVSRACWGMHGHELGQIRHLVFIDEQKVDRSEEFDGLDEESIHIVARLDVTGEAIGTGRLLLTGQIGRMAVLKPYRKQGVGGRILNACVQAAQSVGLRTDDLFLHAQEHAIPFYESHQFVAVGAEFQEANITHRKMVLTD